MFSAQTEDAQMPASKDINNETIRRQFRANWSDTDIFELDVALIVDKLIGSRLVEMDQRVDRLRQELQESFARVDKRLDKVESKIDILLRRPFRPSRKKRPRRRHR